jgi:phosphate transport system substrate-binding protein
MKTCLARWPGWIALLVISGGLWAGGGEPAASRDPAAVQTARQKLLEAKRHKVFYSKRWDLSTLPAYAPHGNISGVIRFWGSNYFADGQLGKFWKEGFQRYHPDVTWDDHLKTSGAAIPALVTGVGDIGANHKITWKELLVFERTFGYQPLEITVVNGSLNVSGWSNALAIIVHKDNPLTSVTLQQLDGIFGGPRQGGWVGSQWHPEFIRGAESNIRTWGQVGLGSEWASRPIDAYGLNLKYDQSDDFSRWVLQGSDQWNENIRHFANYARPDGTLAVDARQLMDAIAHDPAAIGYGNMSDLTPETKALAVAPDAHSPAIAPTLESARDGTYPLHEEVYFYINRAPGQPIDPKVREFLRYILSREGQEAVQRDGKYLPLTASVARAQSAKLD